MARETFISYKYSEARILRDKILDKLGDDAKYYRGETAESPNLVSTTVENIKNNLKDMIFGTSVTIVIVSPNMIQSNWMEWEVGYSLKEVMREDRTSKTNGVVGVIMKVSNSYNWLVQNYVYPDGCSSRSINDDFLFNVIKRNRFNLTTPEFACANCRTFDRLRGSYISLIEEDLFLNDPDEYIENSYEKSRQLDKYKLCKES